MKRLVLRVLLPLAMAAAAWRVGHRLVALELALGDSSPRGLERALLWDAENPDLPFLLAGDYRDLPGIRNLEMAGRHALRAAELAPHSWQARWRLAQLLEVAGRAEEAEIALLRALALNPRDGVMSWRLANFYVRSGELGKAFGPLEDAVAADRSRWRPALSLLLKLEADLTTIDEVWPDEKESRWFLFDQLLRHREHFGANLLDTYLLEQWQRLSSISSELTLARGSPYVSYLLQSGRTGDARQVWIALAARNGQEDAAFANEENRIWNGGFELPLVDAPLGWRISRSPSWRAAAAKEGIDDSTALRIDFDGAENLSFSGVRQTVLVQPGRRHELSCQIRSRGLSTDQGVYLEVYEPLGKRILLRTDEIRGTTPWSRIFSAFETAEGVDTVELRVQRDRSLQLDSRLSGTVWLDEVQVLAR
jgi:tetratricopeptide (TPR) repeat protein